MKVWDARPWTEALRAEQRALALLRHFAANHLADDPVPKERFLDLIRTDRTIPEAARQRALELAPDYWERAQRTRMPDMEP